MNEASSRKFGASRNIYNLHANVNKNEVSFRIRVKNLKKVGIQSDFVMDFTNEDPCALIIGKNGDGKTTVTQDAPVLCIYGPKIYKNAKNFFSVQNGEPAEIELLGYPLPNGEVIDIKRVIHFKKGNGQLIESDLYVNGRITREDDFLKNFPDFDIFMSILNPARFFSKSKADQVRMVNDIMGSRVQDIDLMILSDQKERKKIEKKLQREMSDEDIEIMVNACRLWMKEYFVLLEVDEGDKFLETNVSDIANDEEQVQRKRYIFAEKGSADVEESNNKLEDFLRGQIVLDDDTMKRVSAAVREKRREFEGRQAEMERLLGELKAQHAIIAEKFKGKSDTYKTQEEIQGALKSNANEKFALSEKLSRVRAFQNARDSIKAADANVRAIAGNWNEKLAEFNKENEKFGLINGINFEQFNEGNIAATTNFRIGGVTLDRSMLASLIRQISGSENSQEKQRANIRVSIAKDSLEKTISRLSEIEKERNHKIKTLENDLELIIEKYVMSFPKGDKREKAMQQKEKFFSSPDVLMNLYSDKIAEIEQMVIGKIQIGEFEKSILNNIAEGKILVGQNGGAKITEEDVRNVAKAVLCQTCDQSLIETRKRMLRVVPLIESAIALKKEIDIHVKNYSDNIRKVETEIRTTERELKNAQEALAVFREKDKALAGKVKTIADKLGCAEGEVIGRLDEIASFIERIEAEKKSFEMAKTINSDMGFYKRNLKELSVISIDSLEAKNQELLGRERDLIEYHRTFETRVGIEERMLSLTSELTLNGAHIKILNVLDSIYSVYHEFVWNKNMTMLSSEIESRSSGRLRLGKTTKGVVLEMKQNIGNETFFTRDLSKGEGILANYVFSDTMEIISGSRLPIRYFDTVEELDYENREFIYAMIKGDLESSERGKRFIMFTKVDHYNETNGLTVLNGISSILGSEIGSIAKIKLNAMSDVASMRPKKRLKVV